MDSPKFPKQVKASNKLEPETGLPGRASGKEPTCQCKRHKRHRFDSYVEKIPWKRAWQSTLGESHGQRSLATVHRVAKSQTLLM